MNRLGWMNKSGRPLSSTMDDMGERKSVFNIGTIAASNIADSTSSMTSVDFSSRGLLIFGLNFNNNNNSRINSKSSEICWIMMVNSLSSMALSSGTLS